MCCAVCLRDEQRVNSDVAECSHIECPHRRRLTASAPQLDASRAGWLRLHELDGCYRATPTTKE